MMPMTGKQRVLATFENKPVDKIPVHHSSISADAASIIVGRAVVAGGDSCAWEGIKALWEGGEEGYDAFAERAEQDALDITRALDQDVHRYKYWPMWSKDRKPVKRIDEYTFLFGNPDDRWYTMTYHPELELLTRQNGRGGHVISAAELTYDGMITEEQFRRQVEQAEAQAAASTGVVDEEEAHRVYKQYDQYLLKLGGGTIGVNVQSSNDLIALQLWPELYTRKLKARALQIKKGIPTLAKAGMQVSFSGSDFCSNTGPIYSPASLRQVIIPVLKEVVDAYHAAGIRVLYASDGDFWSVADDFFHTAGIDGWYEVDKSAGMDLRRLRERYPDRVFLGNIQTQVLHRGTPDDVKREVMECLAAAHECGGIIVGASNLIMPGTPPENLFMMLETLRDNR
ncbi:MAG TPA: hypothetical protein GXZ82_12290 [Firmicutes bacterium]|jgi:hypothetical protein|nr:hypothetical protein [Bacillota bacterium]